MHINKQIGWTIVLIAVLMLALGFFLGSTVQSGMLQAEIPYSDTGNWDSNF